MANMLGYPVGGAFDSSMDKINGLLSSFEKSDKAKEYVTSLNMNGGGSKNIAYLEEFKKILNDLENNGEMRHYRDKFGEKFSESWSQVMMQTYIPKSNGDQFLTWIDKKNSDEVKNYQD